MSQKYKLSSVLTGHSLDVRSITVTENDSIISGSRDKTAKLWIPNQINTGYVNLQTYSDQKNFVIAVLSLEPTSDYPDGLIIAAGNDHVIYVYKPSEPFATFKFQEHTNAVSCLSKSSTHAFFSGSWDNTGKLWDLREKTSVFTLLGHAAAIWSVVQLGNSQIVTASADKTIGIWTKEGTRLKSLIGHTDCVRALLDQPTLQQFVSVANDASIKIWSYDGQNLNTLYGHTNYIYSIAGLGPNSFVCSDEDRTVRIWENGVNTETFQLPAQSVWSVSCLKNGDIVTGSSDGVVRIFSRSEARHANSDVLKAFEAEVEALNLSSTQEIGGYKVSDLPGPEALYDPGRKAGQMKMIREGAGVVAYTWVEDGENSHWEKIGDVLGSTDKTNQDKTMFEGRAYDFVFSIDVEDGKPALKLPYNRGDDPYKTANNFLGRNMLPSSYLDQIVDFIEKNTQERFVPSQDYVDPFTGGARYTPGASTQSAGFAGANFDPFTGGSSYSTSSRQSATSSSTVDTTAFFPISNYRGFDMGDPSVILGKLKEFSAKIGDNDTVSVLGSVVKLCTGPSDDATVFDYLFKLLEWPDDIIFPVIDVIRMAIRYPETNNFLSKANDGVILNKLLSYVSDNCKVPNNTIVALRTLCNLFQHSAGEELVFERRFDVVENVTSLGVLNKNGQVALSTLLINLSVASLKQNDDLGIPVLADVVSDILTKLTDSESIFRGYVALGTLLSTPQRNEIIVKVKGNLAFAQALQLHLLIGKNDVEQKRRNCALQVQDVLRIDF